MRISNIQMCDKQFPQLITKRLVLRELRESDSPALYRIFSDVQVTQYYNIPQFQSEEDSLALLERRINRFVRRKGIHWAITLEGQENDLLGCCGFNAWYPRRRLGEIGYELERPFWNQGIMTEALQQVVQYGFQVMRLNRIEAWVMPENKASARVLAKLKFQSLGIKPKKGYWNGRLHDLEHFLYDQTLKP